MLVLKLLAALFDDMTRILLGFLWRGGVLGIIPLLLWWVWK